ncbi:MAG: two-component system, chemotaxis family, sensor kinase CheA [Thermosediminibacterales bacterium]|nr:two-component system, chemotaxis family, sensor kinase CheA [Thermosediminibacterales bacterium]MDK2901221.1 two-component system, chemotaxis family, sensor kinase CheA [Thermosediminibacterales bacterium]
MDMKQYIEVFVEEAQEHLNNLNQYLLKLEVSPENPEYIDEIFRSSHTLKGMAGTMGYEKISEITHEMENVLQGIRNGEIKINSKTVDVLFECFDILENLVGSILQNGVEGNIDTSKVINRLKSVFEINESDEKDYNKDHNKGHDVDENKKTSRLNFNEFEENLIKAAYEKKLNIFEIQISLNDDCLLKSARAFVIFKNLERIGEIIKTIPPVEDIEDEKFQKEFTLYLITSSAKEQIEKMLGSISEIQKIWVTPVDYTKKETIPVKEKNDLKDGEYNTVIVESEQDPSKSISQKLKTGKTVRVDIEKLDNLMNLVSELIIIKTRLEGIGENREIGIQELHEAVEYLERITTNLHDAVMKVRMVPIEQVFNRFPRMVRDLSKELNKEINLHIEGEETELDRTVIDEIGDPLIHLVRNAIDHGIETPEERKRQGKQANGNIILKAYHDGNNVVIEIDDDGKGIDLEKVLAKAIEKRFITVKESKELSEQDILQFLFKPGFSTSERITDISGRGVGLDVVKTKIESLGGTIDIETIQGKGSKFIVRLPLTLAIIQALLVGVGTEKYAVPLNSIKETVTINSKNINRIKNQEITLFRGEVLPIIRLNELLDISGNIFENSASNDFYNEDLTVVIVKKGEKLLGLAVDELIGQQEIVIKSLGKFLNNIKLIAGATILGDGQVALILDVNTLT